MSQSENIFESRSTSRYSRWMATNVFRKVTDASRRAGVRVEAIDGLVRGITTLTRIANVSSVPAHRSRGGEPKGRLPVANTNVLPVHVFSDKSLHTPDDVAAGSPSTNPNNANHNGSTSTPALILSSTASLSFHVLTQGIS